MLERSGDHVIVKKNMLLRSGTHRRVSFRGTPSGRLSVRVTSRRGPGLGDSEEPIEDDSGIVSENTPNYEVASLALNPLIGPRAGEPPPNGAASHRLSNFGFASLSTAAGLFETLVGERLDTPPDPGEPGVAESRPLPPELRPKITSFGVDGLVVVVEPVRPDLPPLPMPDVHVKVQVRGGNVLAQDTLSNAESSSPILNVGSSFPSHEIIDVTFSNPNDFPIMVNTFIDVQNDLDINVTRVSRSLVGRLFADALVWLAPTVRVRDGTMRLDFSSEARHTLDLDPLVLDLGFDIDATVTIEPAEFRFLSHESVIRQVATILRDEVAGVNIPNMTLPSVPADFVEQVVAAFFSPTRTLEHLFDEEMGLRRIQWQLALANHPILSVPPQLSGHPDDVAMKFDYRLTRLRVGASVLEIGVDTIELSLLVVLRSASRPERHPARQMRHDFVRAGFLLPRFEFLVDIGNIEAQLDIDIPGGPVTQPIDWLIEEVGEEIVEALLDWFENDFEDELRTTGLSYLTDISSLVGEMATSIVRQIANRDHIFRQLRMNSREWIIHTLDPAQLAVPYSPPDLVDHRFDDLTVNVPQQDPIDGSMDRNAASRLDRIEHLVFLMMENRSFDHMLGYLSHPNYRGRNDVAGLDGRARPLGGDFVGTSATPQPNPRNIFFPDPGHSAATVARQIADGAMNGFVSEFAFRLERDKRINPEGNFNDPERVLKFHTPEQIQVYDRLTRTDLILDNWFSSIPGGTYPNRMCYYTGVTPHMTNSEIFEDVGYFTDLTIFDLLDHEGIEWRVFESDISFLRMFDRYRLEETKIRPMREFFERTDDLPPVTFIDPNFYGVPSAAEANDDHPPAKITEGQEFVRRLIEHMQDLQSWPKTMFVITYDEHGGFADHVPPPGTPHSSFPPNPDATTSVPVAHSTVRNYGVRVPTFVVSDVVTPGGVGSRIYDHATVLRTIIEKFMPQLGRSAIVPERVRRSRHLGELIESGDRLDFTRPRFAELVGSSRVSGRLSADTPSVDNLSLLNGLLTDRMVLQPQSSSTVVQDSDAIRPHLGAPADPDDFSTLLRRLGKPF